MAVQLERHLFTLEEYERMVEAGVFSEDAHLELINGEVVQMSPVGVEHALAIARLNRLLVKRSAEAVLVWVQGPLHVGGSSRPEPDLALLKWRADFSRTNPPSAGDTLLVIEVAETSLKYDREVKGLLYAEAGIPEYWIVNLQKGTIEVYAGALEGVYRQARTAGRGESLLLPGLPGDPLAVTDVLGNTEASLPASEQPE